MSDISDGFSALPSVSETCVLKWTAANVKWWLCLKNNMLVHLCNLCRLDLSWRGTSPAVLQCKYRKTRDWTATDGAVSAAAASIVSMCLCLAFLSWPQHKLLVLFDFLVHQSWADCGRFQRLHQTKSLGPFLESSAKEHWHLAKALGGGWFFLLSLSFF